MQPDASFKLFLDDLVSRTMAGQKPLKDEIVRLLDYSPDSPEADYMRTKAHEMAMSITGKRGKVWSAVGIEHRPCSMNCHFCAFGEKWGLIREEKDWEDADVIAAAKAAAETGASWFTLRTNEHYSLKKLAHLAKLAAEAAGQACAIAVNTGELDKEKTDMLASAGVMGVYHTWRLGEGETTRFAPETRLATMTAIANSPLRLYHMVEPVGPEHSNEEIAERMLAALACKASLGGVMARANVPGTPLENSGQISRERHSQLIAIARICGGISTPDICVVPPRREGLLSGANVVTVEMGAVPRSDKTDQKSAWKGFDVADARSLLRSAGYDA